MFLAFAPASASPAEHFAWRSEPFVRRKRDALLESVDASLHHFTGERLYAMSQWRKDTHRVANLAQGSGQEANGDGRVVGEVVEVNQEDVRHDASGAKSAQAPRILEERGEGI